MKSRSKRRLVKAPPASVRPRHALYVSPAANFFETLGVSISLWDFHQWHDIYVRNSDTVPAIFEFAHGLASERIGYNTRCIEQACATRRSVVAQHAGFWDMFVPVPLAPQNDAVLAIGSFLRSAPTSSSVLESWRRITGRQGHPSDPEFAQYVSTTLSVLVLEGSHFTNFQKLCERVARLMIADDPADDIFGEIRKLAQGLAETRLPERMWDVAKAMVDERTCRAWASPIRESRRREVLLSRFPEHVVVGLFTNRGRDPDPVAEMLRRNAFQRGCVELSRQVGDVISGKLGNHGVTFLCPGRGSISRTRHYLVELAQKASSLARRLGFRLHVGVSSLRLPLPEQFQAALAAAEVAVSRDTLVVHATQASQVTASLERQLRELTGLLDQRPQTLPAYFDRYLEAVALRSGHRLERARGHLEACFERMAEACRDSGALEDKSFAALRGSLDHTAADAGTMTELFAAYRSAVSEMADAVSKPRTARREHSLRLAEEYMRRHCTEALSLKRVAHVAGFAPGYFSALFRERQHITFENYLMRLRVERAQQLLSSTLLGLQRVAELSGLSTRNYLGRVFKRWTGETPIAYRTRTYVRVEAAG